MNLYDDNAILGPNNKPFIVGKKNIRKYWEKAVNYFVDFSYITQTIGGNSKDVLYETGVVHFVFEIDGDTIQDSAKYLFVWKYNGENNYKIIAEMFNELPNKNTLNRVQN